MNKIRFAKRAAVAAGFFFLCAAPWLTRGQSSPSIPVQTPHVASPAAGPKNDARPPDDFAGLTLTPEQKAKISQIHKDFKSRMEVVVKDDKLNEDQKNAMLTGFRRLENGEVFKALTPEQQKEVRQKVLARRAAAKVGQEKQSQPK
jgi:Spy/CpxP family protein refolding chaperone